MPERKARDVGSFNRVAHRGIGELYITQGDHDSVTVDAPDYVAQRVITRVQDGMLGIRFDFNWWDWLDVRFWGLPGNPIRVRVTMKEICGIALAGAGNVKVGPVQTGHLDITLTGTGNISVQSLTAESLAVNLKSLGNVEASGRVTAQDVSLTGAGNYRADDLESQSARVQVTGLGNARVRVSDALEAEINGLGNIEYFGQPRVSQRVNGLGRVNQMGVQ